MSEETSFAIWVPDGAGFKVVYDSFTPLAHQPPSRLLEHVHFGERRGMNAKQRREVRRARKRFWMGMCPNCGRRWEPEGHENCAEDLAGSFY